VLSVKHYYANTSQEIADYDCHIRYEECIPVQAIYEEKMILHKDIPFKVAVITASLWKMSRALIAEDDTLAFPLLARAVFL